MCQYHNGNQHWGVRRLKRSGYGNNRFHYYGHVPFFLICRKNAYMCIIHGKNLIVYTNLKIFLFYFYSFIEKKQYKK